MHDRARPQLQQAAESLRPQLEEYEALCRELGRRPADVALAWTLANPVVTAPIIGPRTLEQLDENIEAVSLKLEPEVLDRLNAIWPGPKGESPEAYAW